MRRALSVSAWIVGALLLLVVALCGVVLVAGGTDSGRAQIERLTARLSAGHVRVSGLGGSFPTAISCALFQLSDEQGVWLTANHISLRWSPLALLTRHVQVDSLHADRVRIDRRPVGTHSDNPAPSIPHIDVVALSIDVLELAPQLAGTAASLTVHGNVHLRSLEDMAANVVARRTDDVGRYELRMQFNPARTDATLHLQEPAGGPLENLLGVPGLGALSVTGNLSGSRAATRIKLVLDAGGVRGGVQGSLNLIENSADLNYTLDAPAAAPRPGLAWERLTLQGTWRGRIATATANGRLHIEQLQMPGGTRLAALNGNFSARTGMLGLHAVLDRLTIPGPTERLLQDTPLTIDASLQLDKATRPLELVATHRLFSLRAHAITADQPRATINVHLPNLAPLAALVGQDVRGSATFSGQVSRARATTRLTLDGSAGVAGGTANWAGALGNSARLQLSAALTDQTFRVEQLLLTGRKLSLSLSGSRTAAHPTGSDAERAGVAAAKVNARWELNVTDLAALSPALAGALKLSGHIDGPTADAVLTSTLSVRGSPRSVVSADLHASDLLTVPRGTIQAQGTFDGAPLVIDTALRWESGHALNVLIRHADWKCLSIEGELTGGADLSQTRGQLRVRCGQLADLQRLLGMNVLGRAAGTLALTSGNEGTSRTHAQLKLDAYDVVAGKLAGDVQLTADGVMDSLNLQLAAQLPDLGGAPASLSSTAKLNLTSRELRVASAQAAYRGQALRLLSPAHLSLADGLNITGLKLGAQQAVLTLEGRVFPALDLRAAVHQVKPSLINAFVPGLLSEGSIEVEAQLGGSIAAPTGRVQLNATGMRLASNEAVGLPAMDAHAVAQLTGDTARVDAKLSSGSTSQLSISGRAPLAAGGALDLKLAGRVDVGLISPLLEARGQRVAGDLNIDTAISGTATAPEIGGTISLARGDLRDYTRGIHLSDITAQIVGSQRMLRIASLTARAAPGSLTVTGTIGPLQPGLPVDLEVIAKDAQPIANSLVTANLNADLHVSGTVRERLDVRGTIDLIRARIGIPSNLPTNVAVLDVRRNEQPQPQAALSDKNAVIGLDVSLKAPRQIVVQGRGLDAEVGGELHLRGTTDAPRVSGGFDLQRGSVSLASSEFKFTTGNVSFNGTGLQGKIDPTLDFTAQTTVANVAVILKITGLADSPRFELTSTPELPQDEILARLLFGTTAAQLGPLQVAQIGAALATLSGGGSALNPLARIQRTLGLDRLAVASASSTETAGGGNKNMGTSIEAGRYVSNRVYVGARQSTAGASQLQVDVNLSTHLKVQTRLGNATTSAQGTTPDNDPGSSIGISYQFEY